MSVFESSESRRTLLLRSILVLIVAASRLASAAASQANYKIIYSGGSGPTVKTGHDLKLFLDPTALRFEQKHADPIVIPATAITEVNYGQEVHRRIGTAVGLGGRFSWHRCLGSIQ